MLSRVSDLCTPTFHRIDYNLTAMRFSLMKALPAQYRVKALLAQYPNLRTVVETTSGTAGLGLAAICEEVGIECILVSDPAIDADLQHRLEALGAVVIKVDKEFKFKPGGFQKARMECLKKILQAKPGSVWTEQYNNADWSLAYASAVGDLRAAGFRPDILVAACGSGASGCGVARALAKLGPIHTYMVDTAGSVLFATPEGPRDLRGLGNSIIPKNLDHTLVDGVFWVNNAAAVAGAYEINQGLMDVGPTSGAAWLAARWLAHRFPTQEIVFICPDDGRRYPDVHDAKKVEEFGPVTPRDFAPQIVTHPLQVRATERFQFFHWNRRTLEMVLSTPVTS